MDKSLAAASPGKGLVSAFRNQRKRDGAAAGDTLPAKKLAVGTATHPQAVRTAPAELRTTLAVEQHQQPAAACVACDRDSLARAPFTAAEEHVSVSASWLHAPSATASVDALEYAAPAAGADTTASAVQLHQAAWLAPEASQAATGSVPALPRSSSRAVLLSGTAAPVVFESEVRARARERAFKAGG
jgi:hypothetical protein